MEYQEAAKIRGSRFFSIVLTCEAPENGKRLVQRGRGGDENTKLTDIGVLRWIREPEKIFRFDGSDETKLNVTSIFPREIALTIVSFIGNLALS